MNAAQSRALARLAERYGIPNAEERPRPIAHRARKPRRATFAPAPLFGQRRALALSANPSTATTRAARHLKES